jgi:hypothetical protein
LQFDVAADSGRFLMVGLDATPPPTHLQLAIGWPARVAAAATR